MKTRIHTGSALALASILSTAVLAAPPAHGAGVAFVTNGRDAGTGSLRHALEVQQANYVIISRSVSDIEILSTLEYTAETPVTIHGRGQTVRSPMNTTLLAVTQGADLTVSNVDFAGPGGFSITNRGDLGQTAGKGIFVDVRDDQEGEVSLTLRNVGVSGVANHGIHVSDCSLADDCGAGGGGGGAGSPASIVLHLDRVTVDGAGNGKFDADGLRVDDRGDGSIYASIRRSRFVNAGADGVELDEGDDGDVYAQIRHSDFSDNGGYCDPDLLAPFLPDPDEAEFDESEQITEAEIPPAVSGSPDDGCFEREVDIYDSGFVEAYEFGIDVDDGIDFDEADDGALVASVKHSTIGGNLDEGVDFDEEGEGYAWIGLVRAHAFGNADDGFKVSEEDGGSVIGSARRVVSENNGGKGVVFEEADDGDLFLSVIASRTANNDDSDDTGIEAVQEDEGTGKLRVRASDIADGIDTDGVDEI